MEKYMAPATTDLCDAHGDELRIAEPIFNDYGGLRAFHGPVVTLKLFEDNSLVREALGEPGAGRILVVDGGGSKRCALLGDQLAELAVGNDWRGVVVYGCIRDAVRIAQLPLGVKALGVHPLKSVKRGEGQRNLAVHVAGIVFRPGDTLYADADGIVVSARPLN
jgi:regulator of ribonuclease activity A